MIGGALAGSPAATAQGGAGAGLKVAPLPTRGAAEAQFWTPRLGLIEQPDGAPSRYGFVRLDTEGAAEILATPADAAPLFGLGGELGGWRVVGAASQTIHAFDADGRERWSLKAPAHQRVYALPAAGYMLLAAGGSLHLRLRAR
ncbi:MAG TPA: hypothetical protein PKC49_08900 [Phycisphaerae bacterium]|nr:hypothetical protein [Phycisphaerae bacterium]